MRRKYGHCFHPVIILMLVFLFVMVLMLQIDCDNYIVKISHTYCASLVYLYILCILFLICISKVAGKRMENEIIYQKCI